MEDTLVSSEMEDNTEIGLRFGDDSQKIEKMNQSFLLLKKKLFRSHDLIQQYSNKMKECERLKVEVEIAQKDMERYKQQHLTNAAKAVKFTMQNSELAEANKRLEKLVEEQKVKIAGDQRHIQQLNCKVEDIEDRHSERVMQLELEKSGLQAKVKDLEQEIKNIRKVHENELKKLERKIDGACIKREKKGRKTLSPIKFKKAAGLDVIDGDHFIEANAPKELPEISEKLCKISDESVPHTCETAKIIENLARDVGVNVAMNSSPVKPIMIDKNIMTDEFYNIKDNPYPLFCDNCEQLLDPMPADAICKAMTKLPPFISPMALSPMEDKLLRSTNQSDSPEANEPNVSFALNTLQRRVRILEKRLKKQKKTEIEGDSSCCNRSHSVSCHCHRNPINQQSQLNIMTEFFTRIMPFDVGKQFNEIYNNRFNHQSKQFSAIQLKKRKVKKKLKRLKRMNVETINHWDVECNITKDSDCLSVTESENPNLINSIFHTPLLNRSGIFTDNEQTKNHERYFFESAKETGNEPLSLEEITSTNIESKANISRKVTAEASPFTASEVTNIHEIESPESGAKRMSTRKRKRTDELQVAPVVNNRSNLMKSLRRLKRNQSTITASHFILNNEDQAESKDEPNVENIPALKRKRIAHIPKDNTAPISPVLRNNCSNGTLDQMKIADTSSEKRVTRSVQKINSKMNAELEKSSSLSANSVTDNDTMTTLDEYNYDSPELLKSTECLSLKNMNPMFEENPNDSECDATQKNEISYEKVVSAFSSICENSITSEPSLDNEKSDNEHAKPFTCVRELRNRQIQLSPPKLKPVKSLDEDLNMKVLCSSPDFRQKSIQSIDSVETLLERHLAMTKKKPGRKPKTLEIAKIIQKSREDMIKQELSKLVDDTEWDNSRYTTILTNLLNTGEARTIAKSVVDFTIDRAKVSELLDSTYTPPAPPMTKSQQKIVTLLKDLDVQMPELINYIFKAIEFALFRINCTPEWEAVEQLARMFAALARIKKDRERVRIMCCDALYCLQRKSIVVLYAVITTWAEVLPMYDAEKNQSLAMCIVHLIRMYQSEPKINQIKKLVKALHKYPEDGPLSVKLMDKLMDAFTNKDDKCVETAIILLCKREGTEWMYKNVIQGGFMKMIIDQNHPSTCNALKLLGFLLRSFPIADEDDRVRKIIEQLRTLIDSGASSPEFQEAVVSALLSLSRHRFEDVAVSVLNWRPLRSLPLTLNEQLNAFFGARTNHWNQIKQKSRKYANNV